MEVIGLLLETIYKETDIRWLLSHNLVNDYEFSEYDISRQCKESIFNFRDEMRSDPISSRIQYVNKAWLNVDEAILVVDNLREMIRDNYRGNNTIFAYLLAAKEYLSIENEKVVINGDSFLSWNSLIEKVDFNIILSAYISLLEDNSYTEKILNNTNSIVGRSVCSLDAVLEKGICENHMHLKASGYTTEINLVNIFSESPYRTRRLEDFVSRTNGLRKSKHIRGDDEDLILCLVKVKIIRMILLARVNNVFFISDEMTIRILQANSESEIEALISPLKLSELNQVLYSDIFNSSDEYAYVTYERKFQASLFRKILKDKSSSLEIYLTNLYFAAITQIKFEFVHDINSIGFSEFKMREERKEHFIKDSDELIYRSVFDKYCREQVVEKIELRIAPSDPEKMMGKISVLNKVNTDMNKKHEKNLKFGIVVHFIKDGSAVEYVDYEPRKAKFRDKINSDAVSILAYIERTSSSGCLVGIDAANYESNCGSEYLAQNFRRIRHDSIKSANLGFTYHVGEDFETILSGIKSIYDTIEFLNLGSGDRIGHAVALSTDVRPYFEFKGGLIFTRLGNYLDSLCWLSSLQEIRNNMRLFTFVSREFERVSSEMHGFFSKDFEMVDYVDFQYLKSDNPSTILEYEGREVDEITYEKISVYEGYKLNSKSVNHKKAFTNSVARTLYFLYQYNSSFKRICDEAIIVSAGEEYIEITEIAQRYVKLEIESKNIVIEVNPTSNQRISNSKLSAMPFLRLNNTSISTIEYSLNKEQVQICINTDDSAIFQTNLRNEYHLIFDNMLANGLSEVETLEYVRKLQEIAKNSCFVN